MRRLICIWIVESLNSISIRQETKVLYCYPFITHRLSFILLKTREILEKWFIFIFSYFFFCFA